MKVEIGGVEMEIPHIVTGLTKDPFACEPVVPKAYALNAVELLELPPCPEHTHYRGFDAPGYRCSWCWRSHMAVLRRVFVGRAARGR